MRARLEFERRSSLHDAGPSPPTITSARSTKPLKPISGPLSSGSSKAARPPRSGDHSPFAGTITNRFADPGSYVTPTTAASARTAALRSCNWPPLQVEAQVPESDIGRIKVGQKAQIRVMPIPNAAARVSAISPRAEKNNDATTFEVTLKLQDPPAGLLRIGMTPTLTLTPASWRPSPWCQPWRSSPKKANRGC